jgi:amino acid adenylation domain-containing protein
VTASSARAQLLAELLRRDGLSVHRPNLITADAEPGPAPLSYAQQRMWLVEQVTPGTPAYSLPAVLRLSGPLDHDRLTECWNAVLVRHPALRTTFSVNGGRPTQSVMPHRPQPLSMQDLSHHPASERDRLAEQLVHRELVTPFDLEQGPLVRLRLLRLGPQDHVLVLNLHHLVGDAWSWDVLIRDVDALYRGAQLAPLTIGYTDFARWQREQEAAGAFDRDVAYWRTVLAERTDGLALPTDRARPAVPRLRGGIVGLSLRPELVAALRELGQADGATLFMTTLAAFVVLLHRYTGNHDITVATPVANRGPAQTEELVGLFASAMPIRTVVDPQASFRELLSRVRTVALEAFAHQDLPFDRLTAQLRSIHDPGSAEPFSVMFGFRTANVARLGPLAVTVATVHNGTSKRDLTLRLIEQDGGIVGEVEYDSDLFEQSTVDRLVVHYQRLLESVAADPDQRVSGLELLTGPEAQTLRSWSGRPGWPDPAPGLDLTAVFERQAGATPGHIAVRDEQATLTYAELDYRANQIASLLASAGVGLETTVGVSLPPEVELVAAVLGVLKAGAAYVPVDPADPTARRQALLEAANVRVAIVAPGDPLVEGPLRTVVLDRTWSAVDGSPGTRPSVRSQPGNMAYLLYTSGSTGGPKAVAVEHRQLLNYGFAIIERLGIRKPLQYAMVQPLTVDSSLTVLVGALFTGGTLHLLPRSRALDAAEFADYCQRHEIEVLKIAPSHLGGLQRSERFGDLLPRRLLVVGGEASDWPWLRALGRRTAELAVFNHYGPTEATVGVLTLAVAEHADEEYGIAPVGYPLAGTEAYVLDRQQHLVPIGIPGELYLGGANLARGYYGRPDLTAAQFVPHPWSTTGERLYRTGDRARYRPNGAIEFLGRSDDQVKVRGFRVELGEIENAVRSLAGVSDAVVVVREDHPGQCQVVAYVVGDPDLSWPDVREALRGRLPQHMVPTAGVVLAGLPLTPHGKVNRALLPVPTTVSDRSSARPETDIEVMIAEVWRRLLHRDEIGLDDNFFDAGGHSMLMVELHDALQSTFDRRFPLVELFNRTTIRAQVGLLAQRASVDPAQVGRDRGRAQAAAMRRRNRPAGQERTS